MVLTDRIRSRVLPGAGVCLAVALSLSVSGCTEAAAPANIAAPATTTVEGPTVTVTATRTSPPETVTTTVTATPSPTTVTETVEPATETVTETQTVTATGQIQGFVGGAAAGPSAPSDGWKNCSEARAAGAAPVYAGDPGYHRRLDRDGDGVGCE
jgi:hypothetical protein